MGQQVAYGDFLGSGNGVRGAGCGLDQHFRILELGDVLRHRVIEQKIAFLVEHHYGEAGDGFAHGADAEDGIGLHGFRSFAVHHSLGLEPCHAASTRHQRDSARDLLVVDAALDRGGNSFQPFRGEADGFRLRGRELLSAGC